MSGPEARVDPTTRAATVCWEARISIHAMAQHRHPFPSARTLGEVLAAAIDETRAGAPLAPMPPPTRRALVVGTTMGAINEVVRFRKEYTAAGEHLVSPSLFPTTVMNAAAGLAAIRQDFRGPNITLHQRVETILVDVLALAADLIDNGRADVAVAAVAHGFHDTTIDAAGLDTAPCVEAAVFVLCRDAPAGATEPGRRAAGRPTLISCTRGSAPSAAALVEAAVAHLPPRRRPPRGRSPWPWADVVQALAGPEPTALCAHGPQCHGVALVIG